MNTVVLALIPLVCCSAYAITGNVIVNNELATHYGSPLIKTYHLSEGPLDLSQDSQQTLEFDSDFLYKPLTPSFNEEYYLASSMLRYRYLSEEELPKITIEDGKLTI